MNEYERRVKEQASLCLMLMRRLCDDFMTADYNEYKYGTHNKYTEISMRYQKDSDIIKLRRELSELKNIMNGGV